MLGRLAVLTASAVLVASAALGLWNRGSRGSKPPRTRRLGSSRRSTWFRCRRSSETRRAAGRTSREDFIVVEGGGADCGFNAEADGPVSRRRCSLTWKHAVGSKAVDAQQAARHLFSTMKQGDQAALSPSTRSSRRSPTSRRTSRVWSQVDKVEPLFGQTSLFDAIAETANVADSVGAERPAQRAAIVVLTDGIDTKSRLTASKFRPSRAASTSRSTSLRCRRWTTRGIRITARGRSAAASPIWRDGPAETFSSPSPAHVHRRAADHRRDANSTCSRSRRWYELPVRWK